MDRVQRIRSFLDPTGVGLEIGPSHSPATPKAEGFDVRILDYLDADGLRRKYAAAGVDVSRVEDVDYIGDGRPMVEVIGERGVFDWIVASHVIEHVPDLLGFLIDCKLMLKPGGRLVLAVPDKRNCFDVLRPVSTVGQVIQAHLDRRVRPTPGTIFDDVAYARHRDGQTGWSLDAAGALTAVRPIGAAWELVETAERSMDYVDVHCWTFVPSSFRLIIGALFLGGKSDLSLRRLIAENGEFFAVLSDAGPAEPFDLGRLAAAAALEERQALIG